MTITAEPLEQQIIIDKLSIKDIDTLIDTLSSLREESVANVKAYQKVCDEHIPTEAEKSSALGFHPIEEYVDLSKTVEYNKGKFLLLRSANAGISHCADKYSSLNEAIDNIFEEEENEGEENSVLDEPDMVECTLKTIGSSGFVSKKEMRPNLYKAHEIIKQMYNSDSSQLIGANVDWKPFGGSYVVEVIGRYFFVELNIDGLAIKEVSESFYKCFAKEFTKQAS